MPNNTTNQVQSQTQPQLSSAELRAHLGVVSNMMQGFIPQGQSQAPQTSETAPKPQEKPQPKEDDKSELNGIKQQIQALRIEVEKALKEDKQEDTKEESNAKA